MHPRTELFARAYPVAQAIDGALTGLRRQLGRPERYDNSSGDRPAESYDIGPSTLESYVSVWQERRIKKWHARAGVVVYLHEANTLTLVAEINILAAIAGRRWYGYFALETKDDNCGVLAGKKSRNAAKRIANKLGFGMRHGIELAKAEALAKIRLLAILLLAEKAKVARAKRARK